MRPKSKYGVIFDFDGVIADTVACHEKCWQYAAAKFHFSLTHEQFLQGIGVHNNYFIQDVVQWTDDPILIQQLIERKEALFFEHIVMGKVTLIQETCECITMLQKAGISCAIGSSSNKKMINMILDHVDNPPLFDACITAENVQFAKPHPEVFLKAAHAIRIEPSNCVVIEDGYLGIQAAKAMGAKAVALTTTFSKTFFQTQKTTPDVILDTCREFTLMLLTQLVGM